MNGPAPVRHPPLHPPTQHPPRAFAETHRQLIHPISGQPLDFTDTAASTSFPPHSSPVHPSGGHMMASVSSNDQLPVEDPIVFQMPTDVPEGITYVNAKQYRMILKRRETRHTLQEEGRLPKTRNRTYMYESRHNHAKLRVRETTGAFAPGEIRPPLAEVKAESSRTVDAIAQKMGSHEEAERRRDSEYLREEVEKLRERKKKEERDGSRRNSSAPSLPVQ